MTKIQKLKFIGQAFLLILLLLPNFSLADEWSEHERNYAQSFEANWNLVNSPLLSLNDEDNDLMINANEFETHSLKKALTLNSDHIDILLGGFAEIDFKVIALKIQPFVEFSLDKQKPKSTK